MVYVRPILFKAGDNNEFRFYVTTGNIEVLIDQYGREYLDIIVENGNIIQFMFEINEFRIYGSKNLSPIIDINYWYVLSRDSCKLKNLINHYTKIIGTDPTKDNMQLLFDRLYNIYCQALYLDNNNRHKINHDLLDQLSVITPTKSARN